MLIKKFVWLLQNYNDADKNGSGSYEGEQPRVFVNKKVAELSKVHNKDINYKNNRI